MVRSGNRGRRRSGFPSPSSSFNSRPDPPPSQPDEQQPRTSELHDPASPRDFRFADRSSSGKYRDEHDRRSESRNHGDNDRLYPSQSDRRRAGNGSRQRWDDKDGQSDQIRWEGKDNQSDQRWSDGKGGNQSDQRWSEGKAGNQSDQRSFERKGSSQSDQRWSEDKGKHSDKRWSEDKANQSDQRRSEEKANHSDQTWSEDKGNHSGQKIRKDSEGKGSRSQEYTAYFASRARELKEEGNRMFQSREYVKAMEHYDLALKLTPQGHRDRAIFHSNKAACLMQIKPVQYEDAISECSLALEVHPGFGRALLRRARAYEAIGKLQHALEDLQILLQADADHPDATEMAKRIRLSLVSDADRDTQQQDLQAMAQFEPASPQVNPQISSEQTPSFEALSSTPASTPSYPSTPQVQQTPQKTEDSQANHHSSKMKEEDHPSNSGGHCLEAVSTPCPSFQSLQTPSSLQSGNPKADETTPLRQAINDPFPLYLLPPRSTVGSSKTESSERVIHQDNAQDRNPEIPVIVTQMRPLKLIYDHDIRLAEMPVNCKFGELRNIVKSRFPSAKSILIKYKDIEGDLVTITSTKELRLAEAAAAIDAANRTQRIMTVPMEGSIANGLHENHAIGLPVLDQLRLHVVEVPAEQEPCDKEDIVSMDIDVSSLTGDSKVKSETLELKATANESEISKGKVEYEKWLIDFAELFRTHLGIDSNQHVTLHELGIDLCAEALEEIAATEEAHKLFELAVSKFRDAVALGYLHWGNVYMCTARKELPQDTEGEIDFCDRLQASFDWAQEQYALAQHKFEQSLHVKPDFCDAMLGLGQKDFESAKLNWSLAIATQKDLNTWDPSTMLQLFLSAEERLKKAAETLEQRKSEEHGEHSTDLHNAEHDKALKSQINLLLGNVLYEHSQVEFRLGLPTWKELLDTAVLKYEFAGAGSSDINVALQRHLSRLNIFLDADSENTAKEQNLAASNIEETGMIYSKEKHQSEERGVDMEITEGKGNDLQHSNNGTFRAVHENKEMEVTGGDGLQSDESVGSCEDQELEVMEGCNGNLQLDFVNEENKERFLPNDLKDTYKSKEDFSPMVNANDGGSNGNHLMMVHPTP